MPAVSVRELVRSYGQVRAVDGVVEAAVLVVSVGTGLVKAEAEAALVVATAAEVAVGAGGSSCPERGTSPGTARTSS